MIMTRIILMTENIKEEAFCVSQMGMTKYAEILAEAKTAVGMEEMWLDVSAINSPVQTCVVGHLKYVNQFAGILVELFEKNMKHQNVHNFRYLKNSTYLCSINKIMAFLMR